MPARLLPSSGSKNWAKSRLSPRSASPTLVLSHGLFLGTTADLLGRINRWRLPKARDERPGCGREARSLDTRAVKALITWDRRAEAEFHQL